MKLKFRIRTSHKIPKIPIVGSLYQVLMLLEDDKDKLCPLELPESTLPELSDRELLDRLGLRIETSHKLAPPELPGPQRPSEETHGFMVERK